MTTLALAPAAIACEATNGTTYLPPRVSLLDETCETVPGPDGDRTLKDPLGVGHAIPAKARDELAARRPDGAGVLVLTRTTRAKGPPRVDLPS